MKTGEKASTCQWMCSQSYASISRISWRKHTFSSQPDWEYIETEIQRVYNDSYFLHKVKERFVVGTMKIRRKRIWSFKEKGDFIEVSVPWKYEYKITRNSESLRWNRWPILFWGQLLITLAYMIVSTVFLIAAQIASENGDITACPRRFSCGTSVVRPRNLNFE